MAMASLFDIPVIVFAEADTYIDVRKDRFPKLRDIPDKKLVRDLLICAFFCTKIPFIIKILNATE